MSAKLVSEPDFVANQLCGKETRAPFKPDGVRPVYCPECLKKKRGYTLESYIEDNHHRHDIIRLFTAPYYARTELIIVRKVCNAIQDELSTIDQLYRTEALAMGLPNIEKRLIAEWRHLLDQYVDLSKVKRGELQGLRPDILEMLQAIFPNVKHYPYGGPPGAPFKYPPMETVEPPKEAEAPPKITRPPSPPHKLRAVVTKKIVVTLIVILAVVAFGWITLAHPFLSLGNYSYPPYTINYTTTIQTPTQSSTASQEDNLIGNGTSIIVIRPYSQGSLENMILQKINQERTTRGISALVENIKLDTAARRHSEDMVNRSFFSHINPDGLDPSDRAAIVGYPITRPAPGGGYFVGVGENIIEYPVVGAAGVIFFIPYAIPRVAWYDNNAMADALVQEWMNSPGHRENILNPDYTEIGIGCTWKLATLYATTDFG